MCKPAPAGQEELCPTWRYHAFLTDTESSTVEADLTHRAHAIIEQLFADLIDGPLAHMPSGRFAANAAWLTLAAMTHNLTRAASNLVQGGDRRLPHAGAHGRPKTGPSPVDRARTGSKARKSSAGTGPAPTPTAHAGAHRTRSR
jgi:hypothetical protein